MKFTANKLSLMRAWFGMAALIFLIGSQSSQGQSQPVSATEYQQLVASYTAVTPLTARVNGTLGRGAATRDVTGLIAIASTGDASLHLEIVEGQIDEKFYRTEGAAQCSVTFLREPATLQSAALCGFPVPWFFPFPFLTSLDPRNLSKGFMAANETAYSYTNRLNQRVNRAASTTTLSSPSLTFDDAQHLIRYSFSVPSPQHAEFFNRYVVTYSNYQTYGSFQLPTHVKQFVEGSLFLDLTLAYAPAEVQ